MTTQGTYLASGSFGALASAFVIDSLGPIIIWIMALAAVVLCDLITGIAKSLKEGVKVRFSRACRDSFAKLTVYFSLVVCASMTQVALQNDIEINKWACLFIILVEGSSICNNILSWHGFQLNFNVLMNKLLKKHFEFDDEIGDEIIVKQRRDSKGRFMKRG